VGPGLGRLKMTQSLLGLVAATGLQGQSANSLVLFRCEQIRQPIETAYGIVDSFLLPRRRRVIVYIRLP
jgi:hypothetical protein